MCKFLMCRCANEPTTEIYNINYLSDAPACISAHWHIRTLVLTGKFLRYFFEHTGNGIVKFSCL